MSASQCVHCHYPLRGAVVGTEWIRRRSQSRSDGSALNARHPSTVAQHASSHGRLCSVLWKRNRHKHASGPSSPAACGPAGIKEIQPATVELDGEL